MHAYSNQIKQAILYFCANFESCFSDTGLKLSSRCLKCGLSDNMERTDEVADQSACRESDQSVNQESAKGVKDYFERFFTDRKEVPAEKDGRKCRIGELFRL